MLLGEIMRNFFESCTVKELSTWIKHFDNYSLLNNFIDNAPSVEDIKLAKKILNIKRGKL
jgi:hypothetical protein